MSGSSRDEKIIEKHYKLVEGKSVGVINVVALEDPVDILTQHFI